MINFLKEFCSTFEELHYFLGGLAVGGILMSLLWIVIIFKVVIPAIRRKNNGDF